jgi:signal transduction histidine kinase
MVGPAIRLSVKARGTCLVRLERADLERVATNLVINARDAMPNGGDIVVAVAPATDGGGSPARRMIELSVADTGVGMDSLTRQRILEPFFTTKGEAGTGLGLSTVDGIVSRLGGRLQVKSERGHGTEVRVLLPEADADDISQQPSTAFGTPPG